MSIEDRDAMFGLTISNRVKNALLDLRLIEPIDARTMECRFCGAERAVEDHSDKCEWAILTSDEVADAIARGPAILDIDLAIKRAEQRGREEAADVILSYGNSGFITKDITVDEYCAYFADLARYGRPCKTPFLEQLLASTEFAEQLPPRCTHSGGDLDPNCSTLCRHIPGRLVAACDIPCRYHAGVGHSFVGSFECANCIKSDHGACSGGTANGGNCTCCVTR